jgi:hypothetical protein
MEMDIMAYLKFLVFMLIPLSVYAADGSGLTRSAGKYSADESTQLIRQLAARPAIETSAQAKTRYAVANDQNSVDSSVSAAKGFPASFDIFDAWIELSGDLDRDGFYHQLRVTFDADVNTAVETVYVKLYLSREGGDWYQFASTDLFEIYYDSVDDTYEVMTELLEGYVPGYYDVMIELHSLYHPGVVATRILDSFNSGIDIALEDYQHDEAFREVYIDDGYSAGHSGSFSFAGLFLLGMLLWLKLRFFRKVD